MRSLYVAAAVCIIAVLVGVLQQPITRLRQQRNSTRYPFCFKERAPYICGHGGDTTHHPPNTAAAYKAALDAGADCMEIDAALTADLVLVASHNRDLQRLLGVPGAQVHDYTWHTLQSLTWPSGDALLTVEQAVSLVQDQADLLIIDLKTSPGTDKVLQSVHGLGVTAAEAFEAGLAQLPRSTKTIIWGKDDHLLLRLQQDLQPVRIGYSVFKSSAAEYQDPVRLQSAEVVAVHHDMLDAPLLQLFRDHSKTVIAWTVNDVAEMTRMINLGVDGVVTNHPGLLHELLEVAKAQCGK